MSKLLEGDPRHGTLNAYSNLGCRCDLCRDNHSAYMVPLQRERRAGGLPEGDHRHGTDNGYSNYGCRCQACVDARAAMSYFRRHGVERPSGENELVSSDFQYDAAA